MTAMDYRQYDNTIGRFNSIDVLAEFFNNTTPYNFTLNNPVIFNDPTGLCPECPKDGKDGQTYVSEGGVTYTFNNGQWTGEGGELNEVVIKAEKKESTEGQAGKIAETVAGFIPFVGSGLDIYQGARDGDGLQLAMGIGFLIVDVATLGSGSLLKGGVKALGKELLEEGTEQVIKKASNVVYHGIDAQGVVRYVGITKRNPATRFFEHLGATGTGKEFLDYRVIEGASGLTRKQAKVIEQTLINQYGLGRNGGSLLNKINSIAPKNWAKHGIE